MKDNMSDEQWLDARTKGIGGSEIGVILGINPWYTPLDVFLNKTQNLKIEDNKYMRAGRKLEGVISEYFSEETGYKIMIPEKRIYHSTDNPLFLGSIDRFYGNGSLDYRILECKSTQNRIEEVEPYHFTQLQWYLGVCNMDKGAIAYLISGVDFKFFTFDRSDSLIEQLQNKAVEFWENHVLKNVPPLPINIKDVLSLYPTHAEGAVYEATADDYEQFNELCFLKAQIKELEGKETAIKEALQTKMKEAKLLIHDGETLATWKGSECNTFDSKAFQKAHPDIYQEFLKQSLVRTFLLKRK
jgi:putative phage-type endonuclease